MGAGQNAYHFQPRIFGGNINHQKHAKLGIQIGIFTPPSRSSKVEKLWSSFSESGSSTTPCTRQSYPRLVTKRVVLVLCDALAIGRGQHITATNSWLESQASACLYILHRKSCPPIQALELEGEGPDARRLRRGISVRNAVVYRYIRQLVSRACILTLTPRAFRHW